jgi:hypothetical protein
MRCKLLFVLDVLIDVYVTPFLYAFFWSNYYARTCVGDMCIMRSNMVVCIGK